MKKLNHNFPVNKFMDAEDYVHPKLLASVSRRQVLETLGGLAGLAFLASCGGATSTFANATGDSATSGVTGSCSVIPTETEGPYPASQVLSQSWIYRANITEGLQGLPLMLTLNILDTANGCAPLENAAVYLWHTDKDGNYSGYNNYTNATFMRGVQTTDANGQVTFQTIFPGWYQGRITHMHFEVFRDNNLSARPSKTSQLAFPQAVTQAVYNTSLYSAKGQNSSVTSFSRDGIFADGVTNQLATVTGDVNSGLVAQLNVGI